MRCSLPCLQLDWADVAQSAIVALHSAVPTAVLLVHDMSRLAIERVSTQPCISKMGQLHPGRHIAQMPGAAKHLSMVSHLRAGVPCICLPHVRLRHAYQQHPLRPTGIGINYYLVTCSYSHMHMIPPNTATRMVLLTDKSHHRCRWWSVHPHCLRPPDHCSSCSSIPAMGELGDTECIRSSSTRLNASDWAVKSLTRWLELSCTHGSS